MFHIMETLSLLTGAEEGRLEGKLARVTKDRSFIPTKLTLILQSQLPGFPLTRHVSPCQAYVDPGPCTYQAASAPSPLHLQPTCCLFFESIAKMALALKMSLSMTKDPKPDCLEWFNFWLLTKLHLSILSHVMRMGQRIRDEISKKTDTQDSVPVSLLLSAA